MFNCLKKLRKQPHSTISETMHFRDEPETRFWLQTGTCLKSTKTGPRYKV